MDQLIPVMNRLQDALLTISGSAGIDLPQIVVVGAQSVGKSSVIESLVGRDFLPRGTGIVTRRPLVLHLRHLANSTAEWGEFGHLSNTRFEDYDEIRLEIERDTDRLTGKNKGISNEPITLKVCSPRVIDLSLVDLPGITKVPVGDQPTDIENQIRKMLLEYISKPNCIILAVTAANTDLANSDSLQLAREVDPDGIRTIGVITKCDLMDEGTDAVDMLMGRVYPLKKGYVGVVCRSQKHINDKKNIRDALKEEDKFFRSHAAYRHIAHRCGSRFLAQVLNQILMFHIRDTLPQLKSRVANLLHETEVELQGYGDPILEARGNPGALLLHFFSKFARNFQDCIDGTLSSSHSAEQLTGGARINYIFHDWYCNAIMDFYPLQDLSDHEIRTAIRNCTGPKAALFVPEGAFEILVKKQIRKLEPPSLQCVDQVYEELQKIVETCELVEMSRFTNLRDRILEVVRGVLKRCLAPANQMIQNLIQLELAYINTNHPDFMGTHAVPAPPLQNKEGEVECETPSTNSATPALPSGSNSFSETSQQSRLRSPPSTFPPPPHSSLQLLQCADGYNRPRAGSDTDTHHPSEMGGFFSFLKGGRTPPRLQDVGESKPVGGGLEKQAQQSRTQQHRFSASSMSYQNASRGRPPDGKPESRTLTTSSWGIQLPAVPGVVSPSDQPSERELIETDLIKTLIHSYFCIVRKTITDSVPKAIMYFMVNTAKEVIQRELVSQLYREELFGELLKEADDVAEKRANCKDMRKKLVKASEIISQIRDYSVVES